MATPIYVNFVNTTLASAITSSGQTSMTLSSPAGIPALSGDEFFAMVLNDAATQQIFEVVYVTSITGATCTIERGKEDSTATTWAIDDYAYAPVTAGELSVFANINGATSENFAADSLTVAGVATVAEGITVTAGGITVSSGGAYITGGVATAVTYYAPVWLPLGEASAPEVHIVYGATAVTFTGGSQNGSGTVTLSGSAVFGANSYVVTVTQNESGVVNTTYYTSGQSESGFTINGYNVNGLDTTVTVSWIAIGY